MYVRGPGALLVPRKWEQGVMTLFACLSVRNRASGTPSGGPRRRPTPPQKTIQKCPKFGIEKITVLSPKWLQTDPQIAPKSLTKTMLRYIQVSHAFSDRFSMVSALLWMQKWLPKSFPRRPKRSLETGIPKS